MLKIVTADVVNKSVAIVVNAVRGLVFTLRINSGFAWINVDLIAKLVVRAIDTGIDDGHNDALSSIALVPSALRFGDRLPPVGTSRNRCLFGNGLRMYGRMDSLILFCEVDLVDIRFDDIF